MSFDFSTTDPSVLQVWTDGAINTHHKDLPGGWASVFVYNKMLIDTRWRGETRTTSQRMELTAALKGLRHIYETYCGDNPYYQVNKLLEFKDQIVEIQILSDSQYLITCMVALWYMNWRLNNWISLIDGQPIKNRDIWEKILDYKEKLESAGYKLVWRKVKGHKGLIYNEVADKLAVRAKLSVTDGSTK